MALPKKLLVSCLALVLGGAGLSPIAQASGDPVAMQACHLAADSNRAAYLRSSAWTQHREELETQLRTREHRAALAALRNAFGGALKQFAARLSPETVALMRAGYYGTAERQAGLRALLRDAVAQEQTGFNHVVCPHTTSFELVVSGYRGGNDPQQHNVARCRARDLREFIEMKSAYGRPTYEQFVDVIEDGGQVFLEGCVSDPRDPLKPYCTKASLWNDDGNGTMSLGDQLAAGTEGEYVERLNPVFSGLSKTELNLNASLESDMIKAKLSRECVSLLAVEIDTWASDDSAAAAKRLIDETPPEMRALEDAAQPAN